MTTYTSETVTCTFRRWIIPAAEAAPQRPAATPEPGRGDPARQPRGAAPVIGLVAYLALVVTLPALVLGHQGEVFPPLRWWRWAQQARRGAWRGSGATQGPFRDSRATGTPAGPPERRTGSRVPAWAHQQPIDYEEAA